MAAPVPPGAPRQQPPPPPNYNPNLQQNPNSLSDNFQNLNLNRPVSMPNSGPRPTPFAQSPQFPATTPSPPMSRPGPPPPGVLSRPTGTPQQSFPPNVAPMRPFGPPMGQSLPFGSRPPPRSVPPSVVGGASVGVPTSGVPPSSAFPSSGSLTRPVGPPTGARPVPLGSSLPFSSGLNFPPSGVSDGVTNNGPMAFAAPGGPRFPPAGSSVQQTQTPPAGPPSMLASARSPQQSPSMRFPPVQQSPFSQNAPPFSAVSQTAPPFSAAPQSTPPFSGAPSFSAPSPQGPPQVSPFGPHTWSARPVSFKYSRFTFFGLSK